MSINFTIYLQKNCVSEKVKKTKKTEGITINSLKQLIIQIKNQNQLKKKRLKQKNLMKYKNHYGLN